ncbi:MAG: hypothetical protein ABIS13_09110, partial [Nitrosospira sp.]
MPSAVMPEARNAVINPLYPAHRHVTPRISPEISPSMRAGSRDMFCRAILRYAWTVIRFTNEQRLSGPGFDAACITSMSYGLPPDQLVPDISRQLS